MRRSGPGCGGCGGRPCRTGNGVIQVMMTIAIHGGRFRGRVPFAGVHRAGDVIMPDGSTELQPHDRVSAIVDVDHVLEVRRLLTGSPDPDVTEES